MNLNYATRSLHDHTLKDTVGNHHSEQSTTLDQQTNSTDGAPCPHQHTTTIRGHSVLIKCHRLHRYRQPGISKPPPGQDNRPSRHGARNKFATSLDERTWSPSRHRPNQSCKHTHSVSTCCRMQDPSCKLTIFEFAIRRQ